MKKTDPEQYLFQPIDELYLLSLCYKGGGGIFPQLGFLW